MSAKSLTLYLESDLSKPSLIAFVLLFCVAFASRVDAASVAGLYEASVPVGSQTSTDREAAFREALAQVLRKVTGRDDADGNANLVKAMLPAQKYIQTFSYRDNPAYQTFLEQQAQLAGIPNVASDGAAEEERSVVEEGAAASPSDPADQEPPPAFLLDAQFAQGSVDAKLAELQVPVWGHVRPSVLVWAAYDAEHGREIVASTSAAPRANAAAGQVLGDLEVMTAPLRASLAADAELVQTAAERMGLPVYLPAMDLDDVAAVDVDALWGLFPDATAAAESRYAPDTQLLMRIAVRNVDSVQQFTAQMLFLFGNQAETMATYADSAQALWQNVFALIASTLAQRYAVVVTADEAGFTRIEVEGITSFADYVALRRYLKNLPPVAEAELLWLTQSALAYRLKLAGTEQQFDEYIALGGRLRALPGVGFAPAENNSDLQFAPAMDVIEQVIANTAPARRYQWQEGAR